MTLTYFRSLFNDLTGVIDLRCITPDGPCDRTSHATVDDAMAAVRAGLEAQRNVYVGLATRRDGTSGAKSNLLAARVLWIDRDFHDEGDAELHEIAIGHFPFPPSLRVASGGGEHDYWILEEPYDLQTAASIERFEQVLKGICDVLHGDRAATDASRVLRVPGTINYPDSWKRARGRTPVPCVIVQHAGHVYSFEDFADFELRGRAVAGGVGDGVPYVVQPWTGDLPRRVELVLHDARVCARFDGSDAGLVDRSDSGIDFSLALLLAHRGLEGWEIEHAVRASRAKRDGRAKDDAYFTRTVERALGQAASRVSAPPPEPPGEPSDSGFLVSPLGEKEGNENPGPSQPTSSLPFVSLGDLLAEPEEPARWLVDGLLLHGSLNVLAGAPKAGKSTIVRALSLAVSLGTPWMGRNVSTGSVVYLALEEKRTEVSRHFRSLGATGAEPIDLLFRWTHEDGLPTLFDHLRATRPTLLVVDTMQRGLRVPDLNDYAQVSLALEPWITIAREIDIAVMFIHHTGKVIRGFEGILGSTAILGSVDTALLLERTDARILSSRQRVGEDLEPTIVEIDPGTGWPRAAGSPAHAHAVEAESRVIQFLQLEPGATEEQIVSGVPGDTAATKAALRRLVGGALKRTGAGKKGDPYLYWPVETASDSGFPFSPLGEKKETSIWGEDGNR